MGSGYSGLYTGTKGYNSVPGSIDYMNKNDNFSKFIKNRKDIDSNEFYDIIAHGSPISIQVNHNGKDITINHRIAAKLLKANKKYNGQGIRLLSCSTGKIENGFAQNLANKLKVPVMAPTDILWAKPNGSYYVASGITINGIMTVNKTKKRGRFKTFYPKKGGKK